MKTVSDIGIITSFFLDPTLPSVTLKFGHSALETLVNYKLVYSSKIY